jgi:hypothetical protein
MLPSVRVRDMRPQMRSACFAPMSVISDNMPSGAGTREALIMVKSYLGTRIERNFKRANVEREQQFKANHST